MPPRAKIQELKVVGGPHNGTDLSKRPEPLDNHPKTGKPRRIGGQHLYIRTAIRRKRFVAPLGRRWGKTTTRPFLWMAEQKFKKGRYTAGYATANHTKAWEMFQFVRDQLGAMVKQAVGEPESQNRYLELVPAPVFKHEDPERDAPFFWNDPDVGPRMRAGWGKNEGGRIYFWSGQHPHYQAVQGFAFPFDRISLDECQQLHPGITRIVNPMLLDSGGALDCTGIPDIDGIGNTWFEEYYQRGLDPTKQHRWASINFPSYDNPTLDKEALAEIQDDLITEDDYVQYVLAQFISGSGAVFGNLDKVFVVQPVWKREHPSQTDGPAWWKSLFLREPSDVLKTWIAEANPIEGHNLAMTVDFAGRTRTRDATIIQVYDMTRNRMVCDVSIRGMAAPGQLAWIEGVKDHYGAREVHGDETPEGGALMGYLRERYRTGVIGHNFSHANKATYVKRGQFLFEMAEVAMIDAPEIREEFRIFKRHAGENKAGMDTPVTYSHPPGRHDDHVTAFLQIAPYMAHGRRPVDEPEPVSKPMFDDNRLTTLERFAEGMPVPKFDTTEPWTWDDVVP